METLFIELGAYFLAGVLQDFLVTLNQRFVIKDRVLLAVSTSFLITIVGFVVLYNIISSLDSQKSILAIVVYAAGIAVGTFLAMKSKIV